MMIFGRPTPPAPEERAVATPAGTILAAFEDVLQAVVRRDAHEQTAVAFDKSSIFGTTTQPSPHGLTLHDISNIARPRQPASDAPITPVERSNHADLAARLRATPLTLSDYMPPRRTTPVSQKTSVRALFTSLTAVQSNQTDAPRVTSNCDATQTNPVSRSCVTPLTRWQGLTPILVAVHETELGLRVVARARSLDPDDISELRSEAEVLLARHGYRSAGFDIATSKKE